MNKQFEPTLNERKAKGIREATFRLKGKKRPLGTVFFGATVMKFEPKENGCPVRTLKGAEFEARKAELEARERAARARALA